MSVVAGMRKNAKVAIAADTLSSQGDLLLPGDAKASPRKIHRLGAGYIGIVGSMAHHRVIQSLYRDRPEAFDLHSAESIFETLRSLQRTLVDDYFIRSDEDDDDQEYDSNQLFTLVISPGGLFATQSYREVTEFEHFGWGRHATRSNRVRRRPPPNPAA